MMGYLYDETKTRAAIHVDPQLQGDGWLFSGDIGEWRHKGLFITGRIKELIITEGGENIAPVPIENYLKTKMPWISNVIMIGDKKKYNTALLTLKTVGSPQEGFTDDLDGAAGELVDGVNTVTHAMDSAEFIERTTNGFKEYNSNKQICVSGAQKIQYFTILTSDLTIDSGMIGPTLKLKRSALNKSYAPLIDALYAPPDRTPYVDTRHLRPL